MSTPQRNRTLMIAVDPYVGDVVRTQTLLVLVQARLSDDGAFCPEARNLSQLRDAFTSMRGYEDPYPLKCVDPADRRRAAAVAMTWACERRSAPDNNGPISPETLGRSPPTASPPGRWTGSASGSTRATRRQTTRRRT